MYVVLLPREAGIEAHSLRQYVLYVYVTIVDVRLRPRSRAAPGESL